MDVNILKQPLSISEWEEYLGKKYKNITIDAVIAESDPASILVNSITSIFQDIPKVLYIEESLDEKPDSYYMIDQWNIAVTDTVKQATEQSPNIKKVLFIDSGLPTNTVISEHLETYIEKNNSLSLEVYPLTTVEKLYAYIKDLNDEYIIFYSLIFSDSTGKRFIPKQVLSEITKVSNSPIYSFWSSLLDSGVVGGTMIDGEKTAYEMVKASLDYINFGQFNTSYSTLQSIMDWNAIRRYNLNTTSGKNSTQIINKPIPIFIIYYREITTTMLIIIAILFIISLFWLQKARSTQRKLNMARIEAESLARHDHLTGLKNRLACSPIIEYEIRRKQRLHNPTCLMVVDIDKFKDVNDTYGHDIGDLVLKSVAESLKDSVRSTDTLARWGGEEFIIMTPDTDRESAEIMANKIRKAIEALQFEHNRPVTISIGISELHESDDFNTWFEKTDKALYMAKEQGRNRVVIHTVDN